ncbi:MAG TPA: hypothetical protein VII69_02270 [Candidatus Eremiobacteraceae bacterium]
MNFACALSSALAVFALLGSAPQTAANIAQRHVAAIGGHDRAAALTSLSYTGVYREGDFTLAASQTYMRPYYETVDPHLDPAIREGDDGRPWEYYAEYGVVLRTFGAPGMATTHASEFDDSLVDADAKGTHIALAGTAEIQGRPAFDILVTLRDDFAKHLYIDQTTYLIVASRQTAKVHAFGSRVTSQTLFGGYRRVAGVLLPTTSREVDLATGRELNRLTWTNVVANRPISISAFSPPRFTRTPLSALLEDLYDHRDDARYDAQAYESFRRRAAGVNTESAIEFIGYQILKTGVSASAIALLSKNAREYPRSADAQFGLGRAYRTAGLSRLAVAAFRQALRLKPNGARARDALKQS